MRRPHSRWKVGWGIAVFVCVTSKNDQIDLLVNGVVDDLVKGTEKIHHPYRQSRIGIMATVVGNVDMGISKVEEANWLGHS